MLKKAKGNPFIFTKGAITPEEHSANRSFAAYKAGGDNQLESCEKEVREIFEEIQATGVLRWHEYNEEDEHHINKCGLCSYEALKQKYGGK